MPFVKRHHVAEDGMQVIRYLKFFWSPDIIECKARFGMRSW